MLLQDQEKARVTARYVAQRLDRLAIETERGWQGEAVPGNGFVFVRSRLGVTERHPLDADLIRSAESRRLDERAAELQETYEKPGKLVAKDREFPVSGPTALVEAVMELGPKKGDVQRYKGLGEMNPEQLWETTLDPDARTLLQVKVAHADLAEEIFSTLMGDLVEPRRDFIQQNALEVANLDV
jgi:DNA gyrase subunit B